eukprot:TRINITY_DN710_c1_g1_i1.p1 TRINITY_DN710_c1_g1~~TRINITY_DN710_c1_g1_i1.p1  ORF type:complete len:359 (-),score=46.73 TRINITY_DN710_c1_g1_i1:69-1145(-)
MDFKDLSAIAVTAGPGMSSCLSVGLDKAKDLARRHNLPLVAVNHLEGHALVPRLADSNIKFPFLTLLVSGGHTQLLVCHGIDDYVLLGSTRDDAVGEAFDKVARALGIEFGDMEPSQGRDNKGNTMGVSGGEALERLASQGRHSAYPFSIPMGHIHNCDFSFSGLKTAVHRKIVELKHAHLQALDTTAEPSPPKKTQSTDVYAPEIAHVQLDRAVLADVAASFQYTVARHLEVRTTRALEWCRANLHSPLRTLVISGGVARNMYLRNRLSNCARNFGVTVQCPPPRLCTDNGVMIAWAGVERLAMGLVSDIETTTYHPVWPLDKQKRSLFTSRPVASPVAPPIVDHLFPVHLESGIKS